MFLYGGNDGLNTVIPYTDPTYVAKRGPLALGAAQGVLPIGGGLALHPAMTGIKAMFDRSDYAVVRGVGYPFPDRSHFRSTDIWESAATRRRGRHGLDRTLARQHDQPARRSRREQHASPHAARRRWRPA